VSRIELVNRELKYYVTRLKTNQPFAVSRYGDGEWKTILIGDPGGELNGHNSNGCTFTRRLSNELRRVLRVQYPPPFEYGLLRIANRKLGKDIKYFMSRTNLSKIKFTYADIMLHRNLDGSFLPFLKEMRKKKVLYVGPQHCRRLGAKGFFDLVEFVDIPQHNSSNDKKRIVNEILRKIKEHNVDVVGFSAGIHAKIFIADVWGNTKGRVTLIDFGSMWDGFFGVPSRSYVRRGKVDFRGLLEVYTGKRKAKKGESFRL